jgi:hypothetical protein
MTPERLAEIDARIESSHVHFGDDVSSECAELIAACRDLMRERSERLSSTTDVINIIVAENARLREALEWYADPTNHQLTIIEETGIVYSDNGERALKALEEK